MEKIKIKVITVGHIYPDLQRQKIKRWNSSLFEIVGDIESISLRKDSDGHCWDFSDSNLETVIPSNFTQDYLIAIVNVPLEDNWYSRRLSNNRIVLTFHEMKEILIDANIPLENIIYRLLYASALVFKRYGNTIPSVHEQTNITHDETRGCIFDMNGLKLDVVYSCHKPIICPECIERLRHGSVSDETIKESQKEIKRIRKIFFYRIAEFIKQYPIWSLVISITSGIILSAVGSVIGSYIYEIISKSIKQ